MGWYLHFYKYVGAPVARDVPSAPAIQPKRPPHPSQGISTQCFVSWRRLLSKQRAFVIGTAGRNMATFATFVVFVYICIEKLKTHSVFMIYHGGYIEIRLPEIIQGKYAKDFGVGFYCTEIEVQAIRWAKRYETAIVSVYDFKPTADLKILNFSEMTEDWLDFVVKSRVGIEHDYDIVSGPMANDQIYNYVSDYINGILTKEQFWILAKFKHPTHQICFCTARALNCISFIKSEKHGR